MGKKTIIEEVFKSFGLGSLVDALKNSEAFKKRLEEVNEQIEEKLKQGTGERRPEVMYSFSVRTLSGSAGPPRSIPPKGRPPMGRRPATYGEKRKPPVAKAEKLETKPESFIDIFDEGDYISVIATLPGIKKEELTVEVKGEMLVLSAASFRREVRLPCGVRGEPEVSFKNGVFDIRLQKQPKEQEPQTL